MGRELQRLKRRKATTKHMEELLDHAPTTLVVHYSCESFYDRTDGKGLFTNNMITLTWSN